MTIIKVSFNIFFLLNNGMTMVTIGKLLSNEKQIIKEIADNYESNLTSEFYVARRNLMVACGILAFLMLAVLESGQLSIEFTFFVKTPINVGILVFMLVLTCSYFYMRFSALAKVGLLRTHEKSQIKYLEQVSLDKFNQSLQRKIEALHSASRDSYPRFQFNSCSINDIAKATAQTDLTVHYRFDSKHWGKITKDEIEETMNILAMTPKYHSFDNGDSAITVEQTIQLDHIDLSHYKRIERYMKYVTKSLFIETLLPRCFYCLIMLFAASLYIYREWLFCAK